ncbi:MAG TPA: thioredoxin domain-containing protein [Solirubrobacteraceae bacterium]|nr:thioredoxin domain-containing protein [Solirubrobacteraceae bacterium]
MPAPSRAQIDPTARHRSRARLFRVAAVAVTLAGVVVALVSILEGSHDPNLSPGRPVPGATRVLAPLAGIEQQGIELGDPHAPVTLVEFGDLQSEDCARFAREELPEIVRRYVRTGRLLLVFRALDLIGPDSLRAARMALALADQSRLFQFVTLMYAHQGDENSEYVTGRYLRALSESIPGADAPEALRTGGSAAVHAQLAAAQRLGARLGVTSAPFFLLYRSGQAPSRLRAAKLDTNSLGPSLQRLLGVP